MTTPPDKSEEVGIIDYVWSPYTLQQGLFNTHYYPYSRESDNDVLPPGVSSNHNLAWFKANHPDWIEYKQDRTTVAYVCEDTSYVPLDIANPDVRTYLLNTYYLPSINQGYDGIAFDNVNLANFAWDPTEGARAGHYALNGKWVQQYSGGENDAAYHTDMINWAQWMYTQLHMHNASVSMNIEYDYPGAPTDSNTLSNYTDIYMDEMGFGNYDGFITDGAWLTKIQFFQSLVNRGKGLVIVNQMAQSFASTTQAQKQWCIASYLLCKGNHTYMTITGYQEYGSLYTTSEYFAKVGSATNTMYQSQGVYMRDFSNGKAIVNPSSTQSYTVNLPANTYKDLYGNSKSSITLGAASGIVLLKNETITVNQPAADSNAPSSQLYSKWGPWEISIDCNIH